MAAHQASLDYVVEPQVIWNNQAMTERHGSLAHRTPPVVIMEYNPARFNSILEASLSKTHPNFLRSFGGDEEHNYTIYENYSQSLEDYIDALKQTRDFNSINVPYIGRCRYIHPDVRKLLRSILKYLRSLHDEGTSLDGFDIENIVMVDDIPKFIGVELKRLDTGKEGRDYRSVRQLIHRIYDPLDIPEELRELIDDLTRWRGRENLICDHASLWEPKERIELLKNARDDIDFLSPGDKTRFFQAVGCMKLPWFQGLPHWNVRIPMNTPLRLVYEDPTYIHTYDNRYQQVVRFMGNAAVHISSTKNKGYFFQKKDVDNMLTSTFPLVVLELQRCLLRVNLSCFWKV